MKRMQNMTVILASGSPRRRELLEQIGIQPIVRPSGIEEKVASSVPEEVVIAPESGGCGSSGAGAYLDSWGGYGSGCRQRDFGEA